VSDEHRQAILQPEDIANLVVAIVCLPQRAHVPEVVIKPLQQPYV
jgi:NADP-dependent 3-hydroxy acid dehydrogenase YdfG